MASHNTGQSESIPSSRSMTIGDKDKPVMNERSYMESDSNMLSLSALGSSLASGVSFSLTRFDEPSVTKQPDIPLSFSTFVNPLLRSSSSSLQSTPMLRSDPIQQNSDDSTMPTPIYSHDSIETRGSQRITDTGKPSSHEQDVFRSMSLCSMGDVTITDNMEELGRWHLDRASSVVPSSADTFRRSWKMVY